MINIAKEINKYKRFKTSSKNISIHMGSIYAKIDGYIKPIIKSKISDKLSYIPDAAKFSRPYREGKWDGRIRLFSARTQIFPIGFIDDVIKILEKFKYKIGIVDNRHKINLDNDPISPVISYMRKKGLKPRKYQIRATKKALSLRYGIINIPTGTGKTLIINMIIKAIDLSTNNSLNITIITSGISLVSQLREQVAKFQETEVGMIGAGLREYNRITVASIDTLFSNINNDSLLAKTNVLFIDEAHHSPAKTFKTVIYKANNTSLCIGTTATYIRAESEGNILLKSVTGKIIYKKSISEMIRRGWLAKPTIIILQYSTSKELNVEDIDNEYKKIMPKTKSKKKVKKTSEYMKTYSVLVAHNKERSKLISDIIKVFDDYKLSTISFVQSIEQGKTIKKFADELNVSDSVFMNGADDLFYRSEKLNKFRKGKLGTIICTRIINEGLDFPEANSGIRAGAQVYEGTIIQQIGRILRKTKSKLSKDIYRKEIQRVFWVDVCDISNKYLASHSLERISAYESEEEFEIVYVESISELKEVIDARIKEAKIIRR